MDVFRLSAAIFALCMICACSAAFAESPPETSSMGLFHVNASIGNGIWSKSPIVRTTVFFDMDSNASPVTCRLENDSMDVMQEFNTSINGTFSFSVNATFREEGVKNYTIECFNGIGDSGQIPFSIYYDRTRPAITATSSANATLGGNVTLTIAPSDAYSWIFNCSTKNGSVIIDSGTGDFTYYGLRPNTNSIRIKCYDQAGNMGVYTVKVVKDTKSPTVLLKKLSAVPAGGDYSDVTFSYRVKDYIIHNVEYTVDGIHTVAIPASGALMSGNFTITLKNGSHVVALGASDGIQKAVRTVKIKFGGTAAPMEYGTVFGTATDDLMYPGGLGSGATGLLVSGYTAPTAGANASYPIMARLNNSLSKLWAAYAKPKMGEIAQSIYTADNGTASVGTTQNNTNRNTYTWFAKTTSRGAVSWQKQMYLSDMASFMSIAERERGGFIIAGQLEGDPFLMTTDSDGNSLWTAAYDDWSGGRFNSVVEAQDGGIIAAGYTGNGSGNYATVAKFDENGSLLWSKNIGNEEDGGVSLTNRSEFYSVYCLQNGTCALAGYYIWDWQDTRMGLTAMISDDNVSGIIDKDTERTVWGYLNPDDPMAMDVYGGEEFVSTVPDSSGGWIISGTKYPYADRRAGLGIDPAVYALPRIYDMPFDGLVNIDAIVTWTYILNNTGSNEMRGAYQTGDDEYAFAALTNAPSLGTGKIVNKDIWVGKFKVDGSDWISSVAEGEPGVSDAEGAPRGFHVVD
jgi:hypothetical protein